MYTLTNSQQGYIAGIIAGEANISIRRIGSSKQNRSSFYCYMNISNTSFELLDYLLKVTGLGYINGPYNNKGDNRKPYWKWHIRQSELLELLPLVRNMLIVKKKISSLVFAMRELHSNNWRTTDIEVLATREHIFRQAKEVNTRGCLAKRVNSGDLQNGQSRAKPSDSVRQMEGVTVKAEETITPISALLERDDMT